MRQGTKIKVAPEALKAFHEWRDERRKEIEEEGRKAGTEKIARIYVYRDRKRFPTDGGVAEGNEEEGDEDEDDDAPDEED